MKSIVILCLKSGADPPLWFPRIAWLEGIVTSGRQQRNATKLSAPLQWCHNEHDGISNHQPHNCLLNRLFKAQIKENIKALCHWPLWGEFTSDRWIPLTKGQLRGKCFHLMTSSCNAIWFLDPISSSNGLICVRFTGSIDLDIVWL